MVLTDAELRRQLIAYREPVPPITNRNRDQLTARLEVLCSRPQTRHQQQISSDIQSARHPHTTSRITTTSTSTRSAANRLIELSDSEAETGPGDYLYSRSVSHTSPAVQKRSIEVRRPFDSSLTSDQLPSPVAPSISQDVEQSIAKHRREIQQLLDAAKDRTRLSSPVTTNQTPTRTNNSQSNFQHEARSRQYRNETGDNSLGDKIKKTVKETVWIPRQLKESWKSLKNLCKQYVHLVKNIMKALLIGILIGGLLIFLKEKGTDLIPHRKESSNLFLYFKTYCPDMEPMVADLRKQLQIRRGEVDCGFRPAADIRVIKPEIEKYLDQHNYKFELGPVERWRSLIAYIIEKPVEDILVYDKFNIEINDAKRSDSAFKLSTLDAIRSLSCRARKGVNSALQNMFWLLTATLGLVSLAWAFKRRSKQHEEQEHTYNGFVQEILNMLEDQYETHINDPTSKPFLAVNHIHDILIPPKDRKRLKALWERAKEHISNAESRVRLESQLIHGEEFDVWRWIQPLSPTTKQKEQQRSMISDSPKKTGGENDSYIYMPNDIGLTECLKLRNFFDTQYMADDDEIDDVVANIQKRCSSIKRIEHIGINSTYVYLKFSSKEAAAQGYQLLNKWVYQGREIIAKYLRLERYYEHFPESQQ
ncbi:unnamed protein product [Didymodactylos carnosus]|uniref:LEM domain-containing protein n=1 Tax=Didymodactylos carnosus TaxID=1234261 RepID=A0A814CFJ9_9BILA|nr:unnamed protein product [Didymodactylos carnosus]CAF0939508.1 unnamed protein product [Didymodactylos carnosus]CAF3555011.1 unnamed protein product [Didymodactylos carnosus]CAF3716200.1 unnamed protein product [Didymodactylos carnosus]